MAKGIFLYKQFIFEALFNKNCVKKRFFMSFWDNNYEQLNFIKNNEKKVLTNANL